MKRDGTQVFVVHNEGFVNRIQVHEWTLPTANELSGAVYQGFYGVDVNWADRGSGISFKETDGGKMYLLGNFGRNILQLGLDPIVSDTDIGHVSTEVYEQGGEIRKLVAKITNLWCLEGDTPKLFFDGNVEVPQTVVNGEITDAGSRKIALAVVGLPYTCDIELLDVEAGTFPDTLQGELKKITDVTVRFFKSRMPFIGPTSSQLTQMRTRRNEKFGEASGLLSGDAVVNLSPDWNSNGRIFFRQCEPVPLTILAVFPHISIEDEDEG